MGPPVDLGKVKTIVAGPNGPLEGASQYGAKGPIGVNVASLDKKS